MKFKPLQRVRGDSATAKTTSVHLHHTIAFKVLVPAVPCSFHVIDNFNSNLIVIKLICRKVVLLGFYRQISRIRVHDLALVIGIHSVVNG